MRKELKKEAIIIGLWTTLEACHRVLLCPSKSLLLQGELYPYQLVMFCFKCNKYICNICSYWCHNTHQISTRGFSKRFQCECEGC